ncbi:MAG: GNAT family N-acetyltransferase [Sporichthyaceae bacterium]|nr:GNAT family N-acetyltransferase [Sporichthyaceae bacterium]
MDVVEVLEAYDQQLRRSMAAPTDAWTVELLTDPAPMLRVTAPDGASWGDGITWTDLDESTADAAIADAIEYFSTRGRGFEWKHHGYDAPPDLPDRLVAAGFRPEEQESVVVGEVEEVRRRLAAASQPEGVTVRRLREDDEGRRDDWAAINTVHSTVWDEDAGPLVREVSAEQAADPSAMSVWVAEVPDGSLVCAAWIRCHEGTDFASLWGGSTLPQWRGRGIYKALVGHRADEAAQRGFRYLQVDASDDSRPILVRLGMHLLTSTTPYLWRPGT